MKRSKQPSRKGGDKEAGSKVRKGSSPVCYADSDELRPGFRASEEGDREGEATREQAQGSKKGSDRGDTT